MTLPEAIQRFTQAFGRDGNDFGTIKLGPSPALGSDIMLTGQIKQFYELVDFDELMLGGRLPLDIYPTNRLAEGQDGWRWVTSKSGQIVEETEHWQAEWVVIGNVNDDAVFVKIDNEESPVFGTIQASTFFPIGRSLASFLTVLADCMVMEELAFNFDTLQEDMSPKPEFVDQVHNIALRYEDAATAQGFVDFFFS